MASITNGSFTNQDEDEDEERDEDILEKGEIEGDEDSEEDVGPSLDDQEAFKFYFIF